MNLTLLCTKSLPEPSPETFSGTFSGTLLNLTWLCAKASHTFSGTFSGNPVAPCWTDLALHQRCPKTFSGTFSATFPGTRWTWLGFAPRLPKSFSGTFSGTLLNLTWRLPDLLRNSPEPCCTCWTWLLFAPGLHGTFSGFFGTLLNLTSLRTESQTFSGTFGTFSGTSLNLTRCLHQCTPELFWAEDPVSLRCWRKRNIYRRKFRSQTSDNMDRWKAEQGRGREKRKIRRKKSRRERVRRKKMQMREKVGKSRNTVFFQWFGAQEGRKVGSLKRRVRSQLARWEMKNCTPLWREAHFEVKMYKAHHSRTTFGSWDVEKVHAVVARSTFQSHNVQKHLSVGPLLEVAMSKKCTQLWRKAHFEVTMYKTPQRRTTFGSCDVEKVHAVVARRTFPSQNVQNTTCTDHFWRFRCRFRVAGARDCAPCQKWAKREGFVAFSITTTTTLHYTALTYITLNYNYNCNYNYTFTTFYYTTLHYTTLHSITFNYTTLHDITLHSTTLQYITLHYITLHYTALHYTTLHWMTLRHR